MQFLHTSLVCFWALTLSFTEALDARGLNRHEHAAAKRAICNQDNVLRALLANSANATPFCSSYLNLGTVTSYVPGTVTPTPPITETTTTRTITAVSYPAKFSPYLLPTYLFAYPTPTRISSACSCLSVTSTTYTDYLYYNTPTATTITVTTTIPLTGACASPTMTLYPGAHNLSSSASDAFLYVLGGTEYSNTFPDSAVPGCCSACNAFNPFPNDQGGRVQGYFGNCIGWEVDAKRSCTLLLQGSVGAGYLGPKCQAYGSQPGTLQVNPTANPLAVGGEGQCASSFTIKSS